MVEKWKANAARALEQLAFGVEKLAEEAERYNDQNESDPKPKRVFSCPECDSRATVRATTDVSVTLDCNDGHPVQKMLEEDEVV